MVTSPICRAAATANKDAKEWRLVNLTFAVRATALRSSGVKVLPHSALESSSLAVGNADAKIRKIFKTPQHVVRWKVRGDGGRDSVRQPIGSTCLVSEPPI